MRRWLVFLRERLPVPVLMLFSIGMAFSTLSLEGIPQSFLTWGSGLLMPGLFLLVLRFMDEVKDFEKDKVVHPQRPLPRGLLTITEVTWAIYLGLAIMGGIAAFVGITHSYLACGFYLFTTFYLWLMYKEFFVGNSLEKSPFFYAVTHQVILLPLAASIRSLQRQELDLVQLLVPGLMFLGGFFTYEICRKLDPSAHPKLKTYRYFYGEKKTFLLILFTTSITLIADYITLAGPSLGYFILTGFVVLVPITYLLFVKSRYKVVEGFATLNLFLQIWWLFGQKLVGV